MLLQRNVLLVIDTALLNEGETHSSLNAAPLDHRNHVQTHKLVTRWAYSHTLILQGYHRRRACKRGIRDPILTVEKGGLHQCVVKWFKKAHKSDTSRIRGKSYYRQSLYRKDKDLKNHKNDISSIVKSITSISS